MKGETLDETSKTISPQTYEKIHQASKDILKRFEQKKEVKNAPPLAMLLEIETRIEHADAYIAQHLQDDEKNFIQ